MARAPIRGSMPMRTSSKRDVYCQIGFVPEIRLAWKMTGGSRLGRQSSPVREGLLNWIVTSEDDRWLMTGMHNQDAQSGVDGRCGIDGARGNPAAQAVI
jgi:hypothetical protein